MGQTFRNDNSSSSRLERVKFFKPRNVLRDTGTVRRDQRVPDRVRRQIHHLTPVLLGVLHGD